MIEHKKWWIFPLLVFLLSRIVTVFYYIAGTFYAQVSQCAKVGCKDFDYWDMSATWDSWWYMITAENGYPEKKDIPIDANGVYEQSPWAFYPLWSQVLRLGNAVGFDYYVFGSILVVILSGFATLMGYRWLQTKYPESKYATVFLLWFCLSPLTLVMHLNYPEAITFFLLISFMILIDSKKFLWAAPLILLMGFARPIAGALVLFFLIMAAINRKSDKGLMKKHLAMMMLSGIAFGLWPLYVAINLGPWDSYLQVQESWLIYGGGSYFEFLLKNPGEWLINLTLVGGVISIVVTALYRSSIPTILKAWSMAYIIFLMLTVHVSFNVLDYQWMLPEDGGSPYINTSLLRYCFLLLIPMVPLQFIPNSGTKRKVVIGFLLIASLILTIPYAMIYTGFGFLFGYA